MKEQNEITCKPSDIEWIGCSYDKVGLLYCCNGCGKEHGIYYRKASYLENRGIDVDNAIFLKIHMGYYHPYPILSNEARKDVKA